MGEYGDLRQNKKRLKDKCEKSKNEINSKDASNQNNKVNDVSKEEEFVPSDEFENINPILNDNFKPISEEDDFIGSIEDKFKPLDNANYNVKNFVKSNRYYNKKEPAIEKETGKTLNQNYNIMR